MRSPLIYISPTVGSKIFYYHHSWNHIYVPFQGDSVIPTPWEDQVQAEQELGGLALTLWLAPTLIAV